ncbi:MAG: hypothetical protein RIR95_289 [Pseudomonadota bacterium]
MKISLCTTCGLGASDFGAVLGAALQSADLSAQIAGVDCMSGCARPSTISFRAPGKTAYLFGDLDEADLDALVHFAALYAASENGEFADARPLGILRHKAIARIPG